MEVEIPRTLARGRAFAYVLPWQTDEILKVGFTRDPLRRLRSFNSRYFELFDLDRGLLIETERVAEARGIERKLGATLVDHRAPPPLQIVRRAAGHTEWYRGAESEIVDAATTIAASSGFPLHFPLRTWLSLRLEPQRDRLFDWSLHQVAMLRAAEGANETEVAVTIGSTLELTLEEFSAAGVSLQTVLPDEVRQWWGDYSLDRTLKRRIDSLALDELTMPTRT